MVQRLAHFAITVRDYDEALAFYVGKLGFEKLEDTDLGGGKRWVRVRPKGSDAAILLARAVNEQQHASVGNQTGGRVFVFLDTDDFWRDYRELVARGVTFARPPKDEPYGTVAVFEDLYGNRFDLSSAPPSRLPRRSPPRLRSYPAGSTAAASPSTGPRPRSSMRASRQLPKR
ncbi:VOC family protein [Pendulispora albinea]|uniref:VOC family protein n=1 Tax=Pendulispora albinea TaxID=2741071 RepID=A0ABZ2LNT2_9BACT